MRTAFVLSGGASLGAVQVGMLQALTERSIEPDLLVGTSAGALNAAYLAGHGTSPATVAALARIWHGIQARSLFGLDPVRALRALSGKHGSICTDRGLRAVLDRHLNFERLEDAQTPLVVVATELTSGREVALGTGSAIDAVLASCAIPGVFPAVLRDGQALVDGGLTNNTAVSIAVRAGAERVYVLPSGYACALPEPPRTALGALAHALSLLTHQRLVADVALYCDDIELIVLPPPCPLSVSAVNFSRSVELVDRSHASANAALSRDGGLRAHPEQSIAMHTHT